MKDGLDREAKFFVETLADLSEMIRKASGAMGAAVKFMNQSGGPQASGDKDAITKELVSEISKLNDKFSEEIDKESELVKTIEELHGKLEEERKSRISSEKKKLEGEDRLVKAVNSLAEKINGMRSRVSDPSSKLSRVAGGDEEPSEGRRSFRSAAKKSFGPKDIGFKPKGKDTIPAMLSPGEFVVNAKSTKMFEPLLRMINSGYVKGGKVKPKYLADGSGSAGGEASGTRPGGPAMGGIDPKEVGRRIAEAVSEELRGKQKKKLAADFSKISSILIGGKIDVFDMMFGGAVKDITYFRKEARELAFELEGMTSSTRNMQAGFTDMGSVVAQTGQRLEVMQKLYMKNMRKGFKGQGVELKKVLKSGLYLSTMIGSEADETGDMFADWNRTLGMSQMKMSQMASDMKNIARDTGVTGGELVQVMKSSEGVLKNLRGQMNLTSNASKNVISAMTTARKLGIEDKASEIMSMMTSTTKFFDGDQSTRNFLLSTMGRVKGGTNALTRGVGMEDQGKLKGMMGEMDKMIKQISYGRVAGVEDMENASDDDKMKISLALERMYKMDMYQYKGIYSSLGDASKTLKDRFSDLTGEINKNREGTEGHRLAQQKMDELIIDSGMKFSRNLVDVADKGKLSFSAAVSKVSGSMKGAEREDMKALIENLSPELKAKTAGMGAEGDYARSLLVAAQTMSKRGKEAGEKVKDFTPEILKAMENKDMGELTKIVNEMSETSNKIDTKMKSTSDPISALSLNINKLNETIRSTFGGPLGRLIDMLGGVGLALGVVGLASTNLYAQFGDLADKISDLGIKLPKFEKTRNVAREWSGWAGGALSEAKGKILKFQTSVVKTFSETGSEITKIQLWFIEKYRWFFGKLRRLTNFNNITRSLNQGWKNLKLGVVQGVRKIADGVLYGFNRLGDGIGLFADMIPTDAKFIENAFRRFGSGMKIMKDGFWSVLESLEWFGKVGIFKVAKQMKDGFFNIKNLASSAINLKSITNGIGSAIMFLVRLPFNLVSGTFKNMGLAFRSLGNIVRKTPIVGWLFMAVDGVIGAVEGYKKAGDMFGVKTEELTQGMKISAGAAGATVGVLDGLTFGLLRLTGVSGPLTQFLAKLYYGMAWLGEGIKEGFLSWMPAVQEGFQAIGKTFGEIWNIIAGALGYDVSSSTDAWKDFYEVARMVGKAIGILVGGGLKLLVDVLYGLAQVVKVVVWYVASWVNAVKALAKAVSTLSLQPLKDFFGKLGSDIVSGLGGVLSDVKNWALGWVGMGNKNTSSPTKFAKGGIVTGPTNAIVGEAGPEAIIPLSKLDSLGGAQKSDKVVNYDFGKEKSLASQKKIQEYSEKSNASLKEMNRVMDRGRKSTEGLYVNVVNADEMGGKSSESGMMQRLIPAAVSSWSIMRKGGKVPTGEPGSLKAWNNLSKGSGGVKGFMQKIPLIGRFFKGGTEAGAEIAKTVPKATGVKGFMQKIPLIGRFFKGGAEAGAEVAKTAAKGSGGMGGFMQKIPLIGSFFKGGTTNPFASMGGTMGKAAGGAGAVGGVAKSGLRRIPILGSLLDFGMRKASGQDTTQAVGGAAAGTGGAMAGAAAGAALGSVVPVVGTAIGGILGGILGGMGGGALFDAAYESVMGKPEVPKEANEPKLPPPPKTMKSKELGADAPGWTKMGDGPGSPVPIHDEDMKDRKMYHKGMWTAEEHIADRMEKQKNLYTSSPSFEQSRAWAQDADKMLGTEKLSFAGGKNLKSSTDEVNRNLEDKARSRYLEDNKAELAALEKNISELRKGVTNESNLAANKGKPLAEMPSYKKLEDAQKRNYELRYGEIPEKYELENTSLGEDPNLLYESRSKAMARYEGKAVEESSKIMDEEMKLERLKAKRKDVRARRGWGGWMIGADPDKDELKNIDNQILSIEGKNAGWGSTEASVGSLELGQARLKTWEREAQNPSGREVIGKNVWTGQSDTSVFPVDATTPEKSVTGALPKTQSSGISLETYQRTLGKAAGEIAWRQRQNMRPHSEALQSQNPGKNPVEGTFINGNIDTGGPVSPESAVVNAANAMETASLQQATPVGQHAVPVMRDEDNVASVQPVHLRDIAESVLRDKVGSEAGNGKLQSDELVGIEEISNMQYEEMRQIREGIDTMIGLLRPSAGAVGSEQGTTSKSAAPKRNVTPTVYGQLRNGQPGSGANKAVQKPFR